MYSQMRELESLKPVLAQPVLMWTHIWRAGVCKWNISIDYSVFGWSLSIRSYYILFKNLLAVVKISFKVGCYILYNLSRKSYKPKCPILQAVNFFLIVTVVRILPKCKDELWHLPPDSTFCSKFLFWTGHTCSCLYSSGQTRWESSFCWKRNGNTFYLSYDVFV